MERPARLGLTACLALLPAAAGGASSGGLEAFTQARLDSQAQKGAYTLVQFDSQACDVCSRQQAALERLARESLHPPVLILQAGFERDADLRRAYRVQSVSSLLLLRGRRQVACTGGFYSEDDIRSFLVSSMRADRGRPSGKPALPVRARR
jgi:hypothetical protein